MSDQLKKLMIGVAAAFVVLLIILFLASSCQKKVADFSEYRELMIEAAKKHFENNEDDLPTEDGKSNEYTLKQMIENGDIKDYVKVFDNESLKCEGTVEVTNNNGYYLYTSELDCGEEYSTKKLNKTIIEDNLVETGQGLHEVGNEYVFKGNNVNNYAKFDNEDYRIISIDEDGYIYVVKEKSQYYCYWDIHFNSETNETGINSYYREPDKPSTLKDCLEDFYTYETYDENKAYIKTQTVCYGARNADDTSKDGSTECTEKYENSTISLLAPYEYLRASTEEECINISSASCMNYNWITEIGTTFLITPVSGTSNKVYNKRSGGGIGTTNVENKYPVLAKFKLDKKIDYIDGDGSYHNPYIITETITKK